ncbi:MAG: HD-GYP domain-containing protein [Oscillospiraceae bacterium]|jgi:HD-GYP domain-containing protein (c-di-GMP phosphodiesterase class II)|nr:HD-GYP domain-containing protein [Oscillospiraceae bacterium]
MRYIPLPHLKEGMILAKPLYGANFNVLLGENVELTATHLQRVNELGYAGVYIRDALSDDIIVSDVIDSALRVDTIRSAKEVLQQAENGAFENSRKITRLHQERIIMPVIESIIASPSRMVDIIDLKPYDDYVYYHAANVVILSVLLGVEMGLAGTQLYELALAALLHDVGNIFIPKSILSKPDKLTPEEYGIIKQHSQMGFDYLREHFDISIEACMGALQHHENFDGSGYPNQLKKDKISIYGRIIAITDVYDALTSRRPYRQPMLSAAAIEYLGANAGTMFDPDAVKSFKNVVAIYPSGICVELTSGLQCIVVGNYPGYSSRPHLRLLKNTSQTPLYIDLKNDAAFADVTVSRILEDYTE